MNSTLISRKYTAYGESCIVVELWKINGRIFKILGDSHNCEQYWRIYGWSPATNSFNVLFGANDVPSLKSIDYHNCSVKIRNGSYLPTDIFIENIRILVEFTEKFVEALED